MSSKGEEEIDIDDPDFWQKWAKKADLDVDLMNKVGSTDQTEPLTCLPLLEQFSTECRKTKTKSITLAYHRMHKQHSEPIGT